MRFGTVNGVGVSRPADEWSDRNRRVEQAGFAHIALSDDLTRTRDMSVNLGLLAASTSRIRFGVVVTNPVTRHPAVMASTFASVHLLSGERSWMGIGTGNNAVRNLGLRAARLAELGIYSLLPAADRRRKSYLSRKRMCVTVATRRAFQPGAGFNRRQWPKIASLGGPSCRWRNCWRRDYAGSH